MFNYVSLCCLCLFFFVRWKKKNMKACLPCFSVYCSRDTRIHPHRKCVTKKCDQFYRKTAKKPCFTDLQWWNFLVCSNFGVFFTECLHPNTSISTRNPTEKWCTSTIMSDCEFAATGLIFLPGRGVKNYL